VQITHPDYAALVDPLFACGGKRVAAIFIPLFHKAEERVVSEAKPGE